MFGRRVVHDNRRSLSLSDDGGGEQDQAKIYGSPCLTRRLNYPHYSE